MLSAPPPNAVATAQVAQATFGPQSIATSQGPLPLATVMTAVAGAETGGTYSPTSMGDYGLGHPSCNGYTSFGLWQIHIPAWGDVIARVTGIPQSSPCKQANWLYKPTNNAKMAAIILGSDPQASLQNWTTWNNGHYAHYLNTAQLAMAQVAPSPPGLAYQGSGSPPKLPWWVLASVGTGALVTALGFSGYLKGGGA